MASQIQTLLSGKSQMEAQIQNLQYSKEPDGDTDPKFTLSECRFVVLTHGNGITGSSLRTEHK